LFVVITLGVERTASSGSYGEHPGHDRGKIDKLTIALDPPKLTPDDVEKLRPLIAPRSD
jgi:hypothetical protein